MKKVVDLNFLTCPKEELELPSKGKFYKEMTYNNIPTGLEKGIIHIRPLSTKEERNMERINSTNFYNIWAEIIASVTAEQFDPMDLTISDLFYLIYWLRARTFGPTYEIKAECPNCGEEYNDRVNIPDFGTVYLEDDIIEPFELTMPNSGVRVIFRYPRVKDLVDASKRNYSEKKKKGVKISPTIYQKVLCTQEMVLPDSTVLTNEEDSELMIDIYSRMQASDTMMIDEEYAKYDHGLLEPVMKTCPMCETVYEQFPVISPDFFRPNFRKSR